MSETEVTVLSRSTFIDTKPGGKQETVSRIVYQLPDARIGTVVIPTADIGTAKEDAAISASIKELPLSAIERKTIKL